LYGGGETHPKGAGGERGKKDENTPLGHFTNEKGKNPGGGAKQDV